MPDRSIDRVAVNARYYKKHREKIRASKRKKYFAAKKKKATGV